MFCSRGPIGWAMGCTVLVSGVALGQVRTISGTITADQKPLQGVTVFEEGSATATATNAQGHYQLRLSGKAPTVVMRHPDYPERRLKVGATAVLDTDLVLKENRIEEVVLNAGYYKVKERESTGSISRITAKDIENQPVSNVLQAAQGRMAGVSIVQNSGVAGSGFTVNIRGRNSLRTRANSEIDGSQPLYIVDGIPIIGGFTSRYGGGVLPEASINPLNFLDPNDIESMDVLRDADATAIYGSRGANGVVLITTRKGRSGAVTVNLNSSYGLSEAVSNLTMMNTEQYISMRKQAFANDGIVNYPANAYDVNGSWDQKRYTNWRDKLIGNFASTSTTRLSVNGGSDTTNFLLSLGHTDQTTVFGEDFRYKTNTLSSNVNHRSADRKLSIQMRNHMSWMTHNLISSDVTRLSYTLPPNAPALYDEAGHLNWENNTFSNPVAAYENSYSNKNVQFLTSLNADYELAKNLKIALNGGFTYQMIEEWSLRPSTAYSPSTGVTSLNSQSSRGIQSHLSLVFEPQIQWVYHMNRHKFDIMVGGTYQEDTSGSEAIQGTGYESNSFIHNIGAARTKTILDRLTTEYRYAAFFGRINYSFDTKYLFNTTARRDGSSRFGPNKKFGSFGAIGVAWLFSNENFLRDVSWLSFGKVRGSYGSSGSDAIGDYQYHNTFETATLGYNGITGLVPSRLYNPDFSWEKTVKTEAAIELGLFNNRIHLNAAWYRNRSGNQLVGYQLPSITGFSSVLANLDAVIENTGVEFEFHGEIMRKRQFNWSTSLNLTVPRNKLLSFPGLEGSSYANSYVVGEPISIIKLYELNGVNPKTGLYDFTDFNGDGKISSLNDRMVIKDISQKFYGGFTNDVTYKNWNFSFLIQFVKQQARNYNSIIPSPGIINNLPASALDVWSANNPTGLYMPYSSIASSYNTLFQTSTASVSDASYIRLKNLQLTYKIPVKGTGLRQASVYFQGQNLITLTNYFGIDPEFTSIGFLPPLRTYSFGIQLTL